MREAARIRRQWQTQVKLVANPLRLFKIRGMPERSSAAPLAKVAAIFCSVTLL